MAEIQNTKEIQVLGQSLLHIGTLLMSSGANTERIKMTLNRIANAFDCQVEVAVNYSSILLTLTKEEDAFFFSLKKVPFYRINFKMVSGISRMSWQVAEQKWTIEQMTREIDRLVSLPYYSKWMVLGVLGIAGASFCKLAGGTFIDMLVVFAASFLGAFVQQEAIKKKFNPYLCVYIAALVASMAAALYLKFNIGYTHEPAMATSVLFLIPGVHLINSFSDFIDGNIQNAIIRGLSGFVISFVIALGLLTAKFICQL